MPKILIVDDEPGVLKLLQLFLERGGFDVTAAAGPELAMAACRAETFDLILSDVRMPGMNGHELARWVAVNYPSTRTMLMSAFDLHCEKCPYSPRCALMPKPFRPDQIVRAVQATLAPSSRSES